MMIILIITIVLYLAFLTGNGKTKRMIRKNISELKSSCEETSRAIDHEELMKELPDPVLRYFKFSLKGARPSAKAFCLEFSGRYRKRADCEWRNIEGEFYYAIDPPGYFLKAKTTLFTLTDLYLRGKRQTLAYPLNLFSIVLKEDAPFPGSALPCRLAGGSCLPLSFLPGRDVSWNSRDDNSAVLNLAHRGKEVSLIIGFSDYEELKGVMVPTRIEIYRDDHDKKLIDVCLRTDRILPAGEITEKDKEDKGA